MLSPPPFLVCFAPWFGRQGMCILARHTVGYEIGGQTDLSFTLILSAALWLTQMVGIYSSVCKVAVPRYFEPPATRPSHRHTQTRPCCATSPTDCTRIVGLCSSSQKNKQHKPEQATQGQPGCTTAHGSGVTRLSVVSSSRRWIHTRTERPGRERTCNCCCYGLLFCFSLCLNTLPGLG